MFSFYFFFFFFFFLFDIFCCLVFFFEFIYLFFVVLLFVGHGVAREFCPCSFRSADAFVAFCFVCRAIRKRNVLTSTNDFGSYQTSAARVPGRRNCWQPTERGLVCCYVTVFVVFILFFISCFFASHFSCVCLASASRYAEWRVEKKREKREQQWKEAARRQ